MRLARTLLSVALPLALAACGATSSERPAILSEDETAARVAYELSVYAKEHPPEPLSDEQLADYARKAAAFNEDPDQYRRDAALKASLAQRSGQTSAKRPGDLAPPRAGDLAMEPRPL